MKLWLMAVVLVTLLVIQQCCAEFPVNDAEFPVNDAEFPVIGVKDPFTAQKLKFGIEDPFAGDEPLTNRDIDDDSSLKLSKNMKPEIGHSMGRFQRIKQKLRRLRGSRYLRALGSVCRQYRQYAAARRLCRRTRNGCCCRWNRICVFLRCLSSCGWRSHSCCVSSATDKSPSSITVHKEDVMQPRVSTSIDGLLRALRLARRARARLRRQQLRLRRQRVHLLRRHQLRARVRQLRELRRQLRANRLRLRLLRARHRRQRELGRIRTTDLLDETPDDTEVPRISERRNLSRLHRYIQKAIRRLSRSRRRLKRARRHLRRISRRLSRVMFKDSPEPKTLRRMLRGIQRTRYHLRRAKSYLRRGYRYVRRIGRKLNKIVFGGE